MKDSTSCRSRTVLDRGRRCVLGHLAPLILHETNNVLTVMAGVRQLLRLGKDLPERVGPMIDSQVEKMEQLMGWLRQLGPDDGVTGTPAVSGEAVAGTLAQVLRLAGKGRRLRVESHGDPSASLSRALAEAVGLATLCLVLPLFPPRSPETQVQVELGLRQSGRGVQVSVRLEGTAVGAAEEPDVRLAAELAAAADGRLRVQADAAGAIEATLEFPGEG